MPCLWNRLGHERGQIDRLVLLDIHETHQTDRIATQDVQPERHFFDAVVWAKDALDRGGKDDAADSIAAAQSAYDDAPILRDDQHALVHVLLQRRHGRPNPTPRSNAEPSTFEPRARRRGLCCDQALSVFEVQMTAGGVGGAEERGAKVESDISRVSRGGGIGVDKANRQGNRHRSAEPGKKMTISEGRTGPASRTGHGSLACS
ncbi:hypothetical protein L1887_62723 [Cichorium endivia]|nr:hypothetical protein L1887_62723 [Cichorium endivia]